MQSVSYSPSLHCFSSCLQFLVWIGRLLETGADLHSILSWLVITIVVTTVYAGMALAFYIKRITQCVIGAIVLLAKDLQR